MDDSGREKCHFCEREGYFDQFYYWRIIGADWVYICTDIVCMEKARAIEDVM